MVLIFCCGLVASGMTCHADGPGEIPGGDQIYFRLEKLNKYTKVVQPILNGRANEEKLNMQYILMIFKYYQLIFQFPPLDVKMVSPQSAHERFLYV